MRLKLIQLLYCLPFVSLSGFAAEVTDFVPKPTATTATQLSPLVNQLQHHPSPYLALHGSDPVAWQEWNAETLARARRENKLLFVSIGYFSCHWCHVMQRESYKNPEIAAWLNAHFIPVKVDREINGALDAEMQAFAEATRKQAGWPLNVFITPQGYPLAAILYAPPQEFLRSLTRLQNSWAQDSDHLQAMALSAAQALPAPQENEAQFAPAIGVLYRQRFVDEALAQADMFRGGFGAASKFPQVPQLSALLDIYQQSPSPKLAEFLRLTLDHMARLGLYDHVGGGFFRYTVDPDWSTPHYEKMLYDNAQLAHLYARAATLLKQTNYRLVANETLDFMLREMRDADSGAFITSTSAIDAQDREGALYLWDKETLLRLLKPADLALITPYWGLDHPAESAYGYLPLYKTPPKAAELYRLRAVHMRLREERAKRALPKDNKLLAGLNGLALIALAESSEPPYQAAAKRLRDFIVGTLVSEEGLSKGWAQGKLLGQADLDDYVYVAAGLSDYAQRSKNRVDRALANRLLRQAWQKFYTPRGWQLEQQPLLARPYYQRLVPDGATYSPAALLIKTSWRSGDKALRTLALSALNGGFAVLDQGSFWYASQISAMNALH